MKQIITKILPIIIIFFLIVHSRQTIEFSHSILGRLFAVSIIVFYIKCDILYGLLACLLVIFYYQSDFVEQYNSLPNPESCEAQGYFYGDDEDEEDGWEDEEEEEEEQD